MNWTPNFENVIAPLYVTYRIAALLMTVSDFYRHSRVALLQAFSSVIPRAVVQQLTAIVAIRDDSLADCHCEGSFILLLIS